MRGSLAGALVIARLLNKSVVHGQNMLEILRCGETDHDALDVIIVQRTDSYVGQGYSV